MDCDQLSDEETIRAVLKDTAYFKCVIDRFEIKLFRYISNFTGLPREEVEDILQIAFIKAYRNLHNFRPELGLSNWLYRIARNSAIDLLRQGHRKREESQVLTDSQSETCFIEHFADDYNLEDDYLKKELHLLVSRAIDNLPDVYREVAILRFFEDKSYTEISDITMKPINTVSSLVKRSKEKILDFFNKVNDGESE
jgi:RNA polymerase sigma-70 factor (ECF subfamily)